MSNQLKSALFAAAVAITIQSPAFADDEYNVSNGVSFSGVPLGLHGFDSVALSSLGAVSRGDATHTVVHDGVSYYFVSQSSAETFAKAPAQYLPQYGGFCAYAVALGKKLDGDPRFADIVDGKLYLFVNAEIFAKYLANKDQILADAAKTWPTIQHKAVGKLL
jgi:YHS domain-containing protein